MDAVYMIFVVLVLSSCTGEKQNTKSHDYFTALVHMQPLIKREQMLSEYFVELVKKQEEKLDKMEKMIQDIERVVPKEDASETEVTEFLGNPINAMKIIQRFNDVWANMAVMFSGENTTLAKQRELKRLLSIYQRDFPTENDVRGAIAAIFRIQDLYKFSPQTFSDGFGPRSHRLIMEEIFELGFIALGAEDYRHAKVWLREAYERFHPEATQIGFVDKASLLEYLAWAEYKTGNIEQAIELTEKILEINPDSNSANTNIEFFEEDFAKRQNDPKSHWQYEPPKFPWTDKYQRMCNHEEDLEPEEKKKLFCRYETPSPVFILKPVKAEMAFSDPRIIVYHDFMRDREIDYLENLAQKKLKRATVHDPITGVLTYSDYRVSKSFWIREDEDVVVGTIYKRAQELTGLDFMFSEPLQIVNYGIGGHYSPHFDHAPETYKEFKKGWRNRIATALLYMSDVLQGGSTVFVTAGKGAILKPKKGDLVFWYNLKKSGKGDDRTQHAACPVVLGTKWVANFWIHEYGQEFIRRCGLNRDD